jgi:hypothetical protein
MFNEMPAYRVKAAKARKRKKIIAATVLALIIVVPIATYSLLFYYVNGSDKFYISYSSITPPSQFKRGSQYGVDFLVSNSFTSKYWIKDQFTLTKSGQAASWSNFLIPSYRYGIPTDEITIPTQSNDGFLSITVPQTAPAGNYSLIVEATNSVGRQSSTEFNFTVS